MTTTIVVLLGIGLYAHDFVIAGVLAKPELNLTIFAAFALAATVAFRTVLSLRNEVLAMTALQVDYGQRRRHGPEVFTQPAIVFQEPELLGQGYRLISEELVSQDRLQIPTATLQAIIHSIDSRINERKSTLLYFSGLMVFLGLLGAFMGLMKTVQSVGDLVGAMNVSVSAAGTGEDPFAKLIEGMKAPLAGMSVGFSSSLFGLTTSIALGALERFMTGAMKELRNEFEAWLANLALLEGTGTEILATPTNTAEVSAQVLKMLQMTAGQFSDLRDHLVHSNRLAGATHQTVSDMASAISRMADSVSRAADPTPTLAPVVDVVRELAVFQAGLVDHVRKLSEVGAANRATLGEAIERFTLGAEALEAVRSGIAVGAEALVIARSDLETARTEVDARLGSFAATADKLVELHATASRGARSLKPSFGARSLLQRLRQAVASEGSDPEAEGVLVHEMLEQQRATQQKIEALLERLGANDRNAA
jgi:hypothetical protein